MAIIGKIRQRSWILVGFIAIALGIFIIEAALERNSLFGGGNKKNTVGKISGATVSAKEYGDDVSNYEDGLRLLNPDLQWTDQLRSQVQEEVWNTVAAKQLLSKAYSSLGLEVSEAEMGDLMWGPQPHPLAQRFLMKIREVKPDIVNSQTGQLDQAKIREFISGIDQTDKAQNTNFRTLLGHIEKLIQDDQVKQKYATLVAQSFYMPTFMAKEVVNSGKTAKVSYVAVPYTSLPDNKYKITDEEITQYINDHKAKYKQDATRVVDIVSFDVMPSVDDTTQSLAKINKMREEYLASLPKDSAYIARNSQQGADVGYYSREDLMQSKRNADTLFSLPVGTLTNVYRQGSFYLFTKILDRKVAPDSVRAAHILLSEGKGTDEEKKAANDLADSLIRVIDSKTKNFGQLAVENSKDEGSKSKGGDLGYFTRGQMVKAFNDKVFYGGMVPGQIAKVETPYGLHIILLIDERNLKPVTKFADFAVELVPGNETEKLAYNNAVAFQQKNQTAEQFDKAAKSQTVYKDIVLTQNMVEVPQVGAARKLVQWAFQQEKPNVIEFFDTDSKYMIAKLKKVSDKGLPKAEDVREEISLLIRNEKKGKELAEELNKAGAGTTDLAAIAAKVKDAVVVDTAIVHFSSQFVQDLGAEPKFVGTAFGIPAGKISKGVAGERSAFIIRTNAVEDAAEATGDINMYKEQMQRSFMSRLNFQNIFESIMKKADVVDERYKFY
ncbi:MAG: parvulin-like peptidyl-prolyl isomerase [Bacteroidota bacterium]|nr:parvulin-like peptidyl-prolyl isomerase [Bacteroidota bacterium]